MFMRFLLAKLQKSTVKALFQTEFWKENLTPPSGLADTNDRFG